MRNGSRGFGTSFHTSGFSVVINPNLHFGYKNILQKFSMQDIKII